MAYATNAQVASEFKNITFSSSTTVTDTEVDRFIEEVEAFMDGYIGLKYQVPITATSSLKIVRMISIFMVADRIRKVIELRGTQLEKKQLEVRGEWTRGKEMLQEIVKGTLLLSDATLAKSHDGVQSFDYSTEHERVFDTSKDQW